MHICWPDRQLVYFLIIFVNAPKFCPRIQPDPQPCFLVTFTFFCWLRALTALSLSLEEEGVAFLRFFFLRFRSASESELKCYAEVYIIHNTMVGGRATGNIISGKIKTKSR